MNRKIIPEAEAKLTILSTLDMIGPATGLQLVRLMAETELLDYFSLQIYLGELEEEGQITQKAHPCGSLLVITGEGLETLRTFEGRIPLSTRQQINDAVGVWRPLLQAEQQAPASSFVTKENALCLRLQLLEHDDPLLDLLLVDPDGQPLTFLEKRWHHAAPDIYHLIMQELHRPAAAPKAPLSADAILLQRGEDSWMLSLGDPSKGADITIVLLLPDQATAENYAASWDEKKDFLRNEIFRLLRKDI